MSGAFHNRPRRDDHDTFDRLVESSRDQSARLAAAHHRYTSFIDELKHDLDSLSTAVNVTHEDEDDDDGVGGEGVERTMGGGDVDRGSVSCGNLERRPSVASSSSTPHAFETALQEMLAQNERLHAALERADQAKADACAEMSKNNESLQRQVNELQELIGEKDACITRLKNTLAHAKPRATTPPPHMQPQVPLPAPPRPPRCAAKVSDGVVRQQMDEVCQQLEQSKRQHETLCSELSKSQDAERALQAETRKLNNELLESKKKNTDLVCHSRRLAALLGTQEAHRMDLSRKFEEMEKCYEDQSAKLRAASTQLNQLLERSNQTDRQRHDQETERSRMCDELIAVKEKEAVTRGQLNSVEKQLRITCGELEKARQAIRDHQGQQQRNEATHKEVVQRLEDATAEIRRQLECTAQEYKQLEREHNKQREMCAQHERMIESYRRWKDEQLLADAATRKTYTQYEEHIKLLLEDKQNFIEQYRDLRSDHCILQAEVDRLKLCNATANSTVLNSLDNTMQQRLNFMRDTHQRVAETRNSLLGHKPRQPPKPDGHG